MKKGEFLKLLASLGGLQEDEFQKVIGAEDEIPAEFAEKLSVYSKLLTPESAKSDRDVWAAVQGSVLGNVDKAVFSAIEKSELAAVLGDKLEELKGIKGDTSGKWVKSLEVLDSHYKSKLSEMEKNGNVNDSLTKEMENLRNALKQRETEVSETKTTLAERDSFYRQRFLQNQLRQYLSGKKYKNEDPNYREWLIEKKIIEPAMEAAGFALDDDLKTVKVFSKANPDGKFYLPTAPTTAVGWTDVLDHYAAEHVVVNDAKNTDSSKLNPADRIRSKIKESTNQPNLSQAHQRQLKALEEFAEQLG